MNRKQGSSQNGNGLKWHRNETSQDTRQKKQIKKAIDQIIMGGDLCNGLETERDEIIKGKGNKDSITSHRPIAVTAVLYRLAMQVVKRRVEEWAENHHILGELQNKFRSDRKLGDNSFIITQYIEVARTSKILLWVAFLDIKGAYDNVIRKKLMGTTDKV